AACLSWPRAPADEHSLPAISACNFGPIYVRPAPIYVPGAILPRESEPHSGHSTAGLTQLGRDISRSLRLCDTCDSHLLCGLVQSRPYGFRRGGARSITSRPVATVTSAPASVRRSRRVLAIIALAIASYKSSSLA